MDPITHLLIHIGTSVGSKISKYDTDVDILNDHSLTNAIDKALNEKLFEEWSKSGRQAPKPKYFSYDVTSKTKDHSIVGENFDESECGPSKKPWALRYECPKCLMVSNHVVKVSVKLDDDAKYKAKRKYKDGDILDLKDMDGVIFGRRGTGRICCNCEAKSDVVLRRCHQCEKVTIFRLGDRGNLSLYDPLYCMNCKSMVKSASITDDLYGY